MGRAAAFAPDAKLSVNLKAMLKAVDGKASVSALMVQFPEHDAADLLSWLEAEGLIKLRVAPMADFQPSGWMSGLGDLPGAADVSEPAFADTSGAELEPLNALQGAAGAGVSRIVDVMATFVLTHIPEQAFTLLAKMEGIQSLGELEAELPAYSVLAKASGPAGIVHLAELTERLREAAAA